MRYWAFFSYSRADDRVANWLHRQLDSYRTPKSLIGLEGSFGSVPAKLHPIFRDRTDMSGGGQLSERIEQALAESNALIVLCSPSSASSKWVNTEVETFIRLGRKARIFPVITADARDSDDVEQEFFPPALRGHGLLAADLREFKISTGRIIGDGREGGRLKLIAGLLGLPLDDLGQRERQRQRAMLGFVAGFAVLFACVAGVAVVQTLLANQNAARASEREADARTTLVRLVLGRAWEASAERDFGSAARYALASMQLSDDVSNEARSVLAAALLNSARPLPALVSDGAVDILLSSPDGRHLVTQGSGGADVRSFDDGHSLHALSAGSRGLRRIQFGPSGDIAYAVDSDEMVSVWDIRSGSRLSRFHCDGENFRRESSAEGALLAIHCARASHFVAPNRDFWVTAHGRGRVEFARRSNGTPRVLGYDNIERWNVTISSDSQRLVISNSYFPQAQLWSASGNFSQVALLGHQMRTQAEVGIGPAQFSPDFRSILTVDAEGGARIWSSANGAQIWQFPGPLLDARFLGTSNRLLVIDDHSLQIWPVGRRSPLCTMTVGQHGDTSLSGDRAWAATSVGQTVLVWSTSDCSIFQTLVWHDTDITDTEINFDGSRIATLGADGVAKLWVNDIEVSNGWGITYEPWEPSFSENGASISADSRLLITATRGHDANVWFTSSHELMVTLRGHSAPITASAFSSDGTRVATGDRTGVVRIWSLPDGRELWSGPVHSRAIVRLAFDAGQHRVLSWGLDRRHAALGAAPLFAPLDRLAGDACSMLLGPAGRKFSASEIGSDPILSALWSPERDVCEE
ncbi:MAG: TIR domain-containing protein [Terricaulis sp.]